MGLKCVNIPAITEIKLDIGFSNIPFLVDGFTETFKLDRNRNGGCIMIFVWEDRPSNVL